MESLGARLIMIGLMELLNHLKDLMYRVTYFSFLPGSTCRLRDRLIKPLWEYWMKRASCFGEYQGSRYFITAPSASRSDSFVATKWLCAIILDKRDDSLI
eukprot:scaffold88744_cov43-Attheya_sp.AAC.2